MSHEPTREEWLAALAAYSEHKRTQGGTPISTALTAANAIRDRRIRAEALEEAEQTLRMMGSGGRESDPWDDGFDCAIAEAIDAILALKDKEPNHE